MKLEEFFAWNPIFRVEEISEYFSSRDSKNPSTRKTLWAHYLESGRILRIHPGLYATIPAGISAEDLSVDPYLLAGKITDDAILRCHTAQQAHGRACSKSNQ